MADPFLKKQPSQLEKDTARKIVENTLNKRTKPVKFTWEGLKNLSLFFDTNPFSKLKTDRLKDIMEGRSKAQEKDYIDFFEEDENLPLKKNILASNSFIHEELRGLIKK